MSYSEISSLRLEKEKEKKTIYKRMFFPLLDYVQYIEHIHDIIPQNQKITKEEIVTFDDYDIQSLQFYYYFTFPRFLNNNQYRNLRSLVETCKLFIEIVNDNTYNIITRRLWF